MKRNMITNHVARKYHAIVGVSVCHKHELK